MNEVLNSIFDETNLQKKFEMLMDYEQSIINSLSIPKKENGIEESENEYFNRCVAAEKEQKQSEYLNAINNEALSIISTKFLERSKEDTDDNRYYYRIISLEKVLKRNKEKIYDADKAGYCITQVNTILFSDGKLQKFISSFLHCKYGSYCHNAEMYEDLVQCAYTEVFSHVCRYSGKYDNTTFAKPHIIKGAQNYIKDNVSHLSIHYNQMYNRIRKEIVKLKAMGYSDNEACSVSRLMGCESLRGMSAATISATLKYKEAGQYESFDPEYQGAAGNKFLNPEDEFLKQESIAEFNRIYDSLKPWQQFLLYAMNGEIYELSPTSTDFEYNKELIRLLENDNLYNVIREDANKKKYVRRDFINKLYENTLETARSISPLGKEYRQKTMKTTDGLLEKYGSSVLSLNSDYIALTNEDEDLIFALED